MSFEYTSSYFIVIPTGNKKENRKWLNGEETLHPHPVTSVLYMTPFTKLWALKTPERVDIPLKLINPF